MLHKHRIIPGHQGGKYTANNVVLLTPEEHIEAHKKLYEQYGRWQDKAAYEILSNRLGKDELLQQIRLQNCGNRKGKKNSKEHNEKIAASLKGKKHTLERRKNQSLAHKGKSPSVETRKKMSESRKKYLATQKFGIITYD